MHKVVSAKAVEGKEGAPEGLLSFRSLTRQTLTKVHSKTDRSGELSVAAYRRVLPNYVVTDNQFANTCTRGNREMTFGNARC